MALPNVNTNQVGGRSGRALTGYDHYTGLIAFGTAPVVTGKWTQYPNSPIIKAQQMFSAADATTSGVLPYTDNVASASAHALVRGATNDIITITATIPLVGGLTSVYTLCTYTQVSGDSTNALLATSVAAAINAGTVNHGFTAVANAVSGTVVITAPKNLGISLNGGTPYVATITGTITDTITQNSVAGTASPYAIWDYHIREYFRIFPKGVLWVGLISASSSFNEIASLQLASTRKIAQLGIYDNNATRASAANIFATITSLQAAATSLEQEMPLYCTYSPNIAAVSDLSTYPDQNTNVGQNVKCIISQDGDAEGALMFLRNGISIGNIGASLATLAKSRVSASDAQPIEDFNNSNGVENNVPAFANGTLVSNTTIGLQTQLDTFRYTFFRQFSEVTGTFWTNNKSCISSSSDYSFTNDKRTIQKVQRIVRATLIPQLNSEIYFNDDNTIINATIEYFKSLVNNAVKAALVTGQGSTPMISGIETDIDPAQPVKSTGNLEINVEINQNGIVRNITVNLAYKAA